MTFYTRNGDDGFTGLLGEGRVPKEEDRIEALGTLDEATAALGLARSLIQDQTLQQVILRIQRDLYLLMAEVAATPENAARFRQIDSASVAWLEQQTDTFAHNVTLPNEFILPGDTPAGAALSLARTVIRRAERRVAALFHQNLLENADLLRYLNRLSSLCFVLELYVYQSGGVNHLTLAKDV
ncbi:cob(I)yrinic acid a,c-diamide adenosyltransferase [Thermanaerothrix sp.]|jgi:cob(I)alamin adenosyltransferase|uniref:cob(I)yrinic acid a,c-diamide adenosyltransferase n=1 Tax=Thermanaerothrix sp. TaxID=2972675 RepID=UPI002ADD8B73|nr:cob(I)yrinic acid a,c-diamide adenosyltransferase [Thermanaerothrix sp.]